MPAARAWAAAPWAWPSCCAPGARCRARGPEAAGRRSGAAPILPLTSWAETDDKCGGGGSRGPGAVGPAPRCAGRVAPLEPLPALPARDAEFDPAVAPGGVALACTPDPGRVPVTPP